MTIATPDHRAEALRVLQDASALTKDTSRDNAASFADLAFALQSAAVAGQAATVHALIYVGDALREQTEQARAFAEQQRAEAS